MNPFDYFGLSSNTSLKELKTVYKLKLRENHPEDNPEGFRELREQYEIALDLIENSALSNSSKDIGARKPDSHYHQFNIILNDIIKFLSQGISKDFKIQWKKWIDIIESLPLDQSIPLSKELANFAANNLWISAEVIQDLWILLDWDALYNGDRQDYQLACLLDSWRQLDNPKSVSVIADRCLENQRITLCYYQSLAIAVNNADLNALSHIIHQDRVTTLNDINTIYWLLRSIKALDYKHVGISRETHLWLVSRALAEENLNAELLILLAKHCIYLKNEKCFLLSLQRLATLEKSDKSILSLLQSFYIDTDPTFALWAIAIQRQMDWISQPYAMAMTYPLHSHFSRSAITDMLFYYAIDEGFLPKVDIIFELTTLQGCLASLWWHLHHGAWQGIQCAIDKLNNEDITHYRWKYLAGFILDKGQKELDRAREIPIFEKISSMYYSPEWLNYEDFTQEDVLTPTSDEWQDALNRHPIIPKNLYDLLSARSDVTILQPELDDYNEQLAQREVHNNTLYKKVKTTTGADTTKWAEFYLYHLSFPYSYTKCIQEKMSHYAPPLPQSQLDVITRIALKNDIDYAKDILETGTADIFCQREIYCQYVRSYNPDFLKKNFENISKENTIMQLVQACHYNKENGTIHEALIIYKIIEILVGDNENYSEIKHILKDNIMAMDTYQSTSHLWPMFNAVLFGNENEIINQCEVIQENNTNEDCNEFNGSLLNYLHGMCYLLCFMQTSTNKVGFNTKQIERIKSNLGEESVFTFSVLSFYVEQKLNRELEEARHKKPSAFKWPSNKMLFIQSLLVTIFSFTVSSADVGLYHSVITPIVNNEAIAVSPLFVFCILLNLILTRLLVGTCIIRKKRKLLGIWITLWLSVFVLTGSYWLSTLLWLTYLIAPAKDRPSITSKGWPYALKKEGDIHLSDYI